MASDTNVTLQSGNGDANTVICLAIAASATGLALAQAVAGAGNLALSGAQVGTVTAGVYNGTPYTTTDNVTKYSARRMVIVSTSAGDTTQTATFTGTDRFNNVLVETVTLNGTNAVTTNNDFSSVSSIAMSAATAGNISAGTSSKASGSWIPIERFRNNPISYQINCTLAAGGAGNVQIEETTDDPNAPAVAGLDTYGVQFPFLQVNGFQIGDNSPAIPYSDANMNNKAATFQGTITAPHAAFRLTVNSGTGAWQMQARVAAMASGLK